MIRSDRGSFVWLQLLPPALMLALAAGAIVLLNHLGKGESTVVMILAAVLAVAALWLLRIGLSSWHMPFNDAPDFDHRETDS